MPVGEASRERRSNSIALLAAEVPFTEASNRSDTDPSVA